MKVTSLQLIHDIVKSGDFSAFGIHPEETVILEKESVIKTRTAKCDAIAKWLLDEGRAFGLSFEYQGGSEIQSKFRAKAEELYSLFD